MLIVKLNGVEISNDDHNLNSEEWSLNLTRNIEDDIFEFSFTTNITFFGDAYLFVKSELFDSPNRESNKIDIDIYDDCCYPIRRIFRGEIKYKSVALNFIDEKCWGSCEIEMQVESKEINSFDFFRTRLINANNLWDDGVYFWDRQDFPFIHYCEDYRPFSLRYSNSLMYIAIAFLMWTVMLPINIIITIINLLIAAVNLIPGVDIDEIDIDGDGENNNNIMLDLFFDNYNYYITGCGKGHPSPLVRQYIKNAMIQANINTFSSTILNDSSNEYYNLALHSAPNIEGYFDRGDINEQRKYFTLNSPNMTVGEFLDELAVVFNAEWWVEGQVLYFEKKKINKILLYDFTNSLPVCEGGDIINLSISTEDEEEVPRGLELTYQLDSYDSCGNEAREYYNDIVPFDKNQNQTKRKGLKTKIFNFGTARFRFDGLYPDFQSSWGVFDTILSLIGLDVDDDRWQRWMLMNNGKASLKKLLILENGYNPVDSYVKRVNSGNCPNSPCWDYNTGMWVNASHPNYNPFGNYDDPVNTQKKKVYPNLFQYWSDENNDLLGKKIILEINKKCIYYNNIFNSLDDIKNNLMIKIKIYENIYDVEVRNIIISKTITIEGYI